MAINRVIIEGNLTRDVEMRATASGLAVAGFTVAVNEKRKNAEGEYVDVPVFVKCSLFGTRAEKLSKYLLKGTKVTIDGKLRYSQWVKDDEKRHELSVIVDQLEFSGGKREQTGDALYWSSFLVTLCSEIMLYIETPLVSYSYSLNEVSHSCTS